jgi:hypothetical protein
MHPEGTQMDPDPFEEKAFSRVGHLLQNRESLRRFLDVEDQPLILDLVDMNEQPGSLRCRE